MVMALAGCGYTEDDSLGQGVDIVGKEVISPEPDTKDMNEEQQTVGVSNPLVEVENAKAISESLAISIDAPDGAINVEYGILADKIAQIVYDLDEKTFVLRASKSIGGQELSGMHGNFEMISYVGCGDTVSVAVDTVELDDGSAFVTSTVEMMEHDTVYLALSTTNKITGDEISSMINKISYEIANITLNEVADDWGITLTATDVTPAGLTLVCTQRGGMTEGELGTGNEYSISKNEDGTWVDVAYLPDITVAWKDIFYNIPMNDEVRWEIKYQFVYGELPKGEYRISKDIVFFPSDTEREEQGYYATFEIK